MTDDEINRRVAEQEGWTLFDGIWAHADHCPRAYDHTPPYTTDWAWCGPLIEKYELDVMENLHGGGEPTAEGNWPCWYVDASDGVLAYDQDVKRAICLAVIAAHEDKPSGVWTGLGDK